MMRAMCAARLRGRLGVVTRVGGVSGLGDRRTAGEDGGRYNAAEQEFLHQVRLQLDFAPE
jgi:hypothetical protein